MPRPAKAQTPEQLRAILMGFPVSLETYFREDLFAVDLRISEFISEFPAIFVINTIAATVTKHGTGLFVFKNKNGIAGGIIVRSYRGYLGIVVHMKIQTDLLHQSSVAYIQRLLKRLVVSGFTEFVPSRHQKLKATTEEDEQTGERREAKQKKRAPNPEAIARTEVRFEVFKKIKDANPTFTQEDVAKEAFDILGEKVGANDVRNAYRSMNAPWLRSDRIR